MIISRIAALCVVAVALVGCSTTVTGSPAAEGAAPAAAGSDGEGAPVDACKLLEPAEVQQLIGANDGGKGHPGAGQHLHVEDGRRALRDGRRRPVGDGDQRPPRLDPALGPEKPLPDGMRSLSGGQVQFVAGTRDCAVQVVTDPFSKDDEQKAVALAKVVQSRL
jgi:hypothetical protein